MKPPRILIVDDEPELCQIVERCCRVEGFEAQSVAGGEAALEACAGGGFDLIVLDIMLGGQDGFDTLARLRAAGHQMPVIFLSAKSGETDKIIGLGLGADDFVAKPFSPRELGARIKAHLRRSRSANLDSAEERLLRRGPFCLDRLAMSVTQGDLPLNLTGTELKLLAHFMEYPRQVFTRRQLYQSIWGGAFMDDNTIPVYISRLREKIGDNSRSPVIIETVRGIGYRFSLD
jgi:DNA-binding response OmpR family regulator